MDMYTSRLHIRNLQPEDVDAFHDYRCDPEVTRFQSFDPMTRDEAADFIRTQQGAVLGMPEVWGQYGIQDRASGLLVGDCAVRLSGHEARMAEIGITISARYQRQGYAKEVLAALLRLLFEQCGVRRVVETVDAENRASAALLKSIGFRQEGHFMENVFFKGAWGSEFQFALLKREWEASERTAGDTPDLDAH